MNRHPGEGERLGGWAVGRHASPLGGSPAAQQPLRPHQLPSVVLARSATLALVTSAQVGTEKSVGRIQNGQHGTTRRLLLDEARPNETLGPLIDPAGQ